MAIATANAELMAREWARANRGLMHPVEVKLLPAMEIYRFATAAKPWGWHAASWWFGKSVFDELLRQSRATRTSMDRVARACLAIPPEWSAMDVLLMARVLRPLSAWSGTPRAIRMKDHLPAAASVVRPGGSSIAPAIGHSPGGRYGSRWEPDRGVTQLYIPGLASQAENTAAPVPWKEVLAAHAFRIAAG